MGSIQQTGIIALRWLKENPDTPTLTLAKKMQKAHPKVFKSVERARDCLRHYRGQRGAARRKMLTEREHLCESGDPRRGKKDDVESGARILVFDIETSPHLAWVWRLWKENISPRQMVGTTKVLCYSAKWLDSPDIMFDSIQADMPKKPSLEDWIAQSDERVCATLYDLFNKADIVVAHNGQGFDEKIMKARWCAQGFPPPQPYKMVDTLQIAKKQFRFPRNKLESIARSLGMDGKVEHEGFPLWVKCMSGDKRAWAKMEEYCVQDTITLEGVYNRFRAWDTRHPNVALVYDDEKMRCITCGSTAVKEVGKNCRTSASQFPSYRCKSCGKIMRGRKRYKSAAEIKNRLAHAL